MPTIVFVLVVKRISALFALLTKIQIMKMSDIKYKTFGFFTKSEMSLISAKIFTSLI